MSGLKRIIANGWKLFRTKPTISLLGLFTVCLISLFLWQAVVLNFLMEKGLHYVEQKLDFSVYFKEDAPNEDVKKLQSIIENMPKVNRVLLVTKEKAFEDFKKESEKNPIIGQALQELNINPLVDYLIIRADEPIVYEDVAGYLQTSPYRSIIDFITYSENQNIIKRFISFSERVKYIVIAIIISIGIFGALVIFNSTMLSVYSQREEIEVLRLLGASNFFIRAPFIVFAGILTLLGYLFGLIIMMLLTHNVNAMMMAVVPQADIEGYILRNFLIINTVLFGFLLLINAISASLALRKYLKE